MDDFKRNHDEFKCRVGCCHRQPNKVARLRHKYATRNLVSDAYWEHQDDMLGVCTDNLCPCGVCDDDGA